MQGKKILDLNGFGADMHLPFDRYYEKYIYGDSQRCDEVAVVGTVAWQRKNNDIVRVIDPSGARPSELHREITHRKLMQYANAMAAFIRTKFIGADGLIDMPKNTVIPIYLGRTIDTVVAMLAVIRAGAAFVLLDEVEIEAGKVVASERFKQYLSSASPNNHDKTEGVSIKYLLTTRGRWREGKEKIHTPNGVEPIYLDECANQIKLDSEMQSFSCPDQLAYVVYSSGTTGKPKGILIPNSGLVSRVLSHYAFLANHDYRMGQTDKVPLTAPLRFDASIMQVLLGLSCGGSVHVIEERTRINVQSLYNYLKTYKMTAAILVPSQWRELDRFAPAEPKVDLPHLGVILSTGEAFDKKLIDRWLACGEKLRLLVNGYGPSETTVGLTLCLVTGAEQQVTIRVKVGQIKKTVDLISVGEPMLGTKLLIVERQEAYNSVLTVIAEISNGQDIKVYKEADKDKIIEGEIIALDIDGYNCRAKGYINEPAKNRLNYLSIKENQSANHEPDYVIGEDPASMTAYRTGDKACVVGGKLFVTGRYGVNQLKKYGQLVSIEEIQAVLKSYLESGKYPVFKSVLVSDYLSKQSSAQQFVAYLNDDDITYIKYEDERSIDLDNVQGVFYAIDVKNKKIRLYRNKQMVAEQDFAAEHLKTLDELEEHAGLLPIEDKDAIAQAKNALHKLLRYSLFPELRSSADEKLYISLRDYAKQYLNTYMLPSRWAITTISENGKADSTKLPFNELKKIYRKNPLQPVLGPNAIANCVRQAWNKVFDDIEAISISSESKFDELGGDSHAYTMMLAELQQLLVAGNILEAIDFNQELRLKLLAARKFSDFVNLIYYAEQAKRLPVMMVEYPMVPMDNDLRRTREKISKVLFMSEIYLFQSPFAIQDDKTDLYLPLRSELTLRRPVVELKLPSDSNPIFGGKTFAQQLAFLKPKIIKNHYKEKSDCLILAGHSAGGMLAYRMAQEIGNECPHIKIMVIMLDTTSSHLPREIIFESYVNYVKEFIDKTLSEFSGLLDKNNIPHCFMNYIIDKIATKAMRDFRLPENIAEGRALNTKQDILLDAERFITELLATLTETIEHFSADVFAIPHSALDKNNYIAKVLEVCARTMINQDISSIEAKLTDNFTLKDIYSIVQAEVLNFKIRKLERIRLLQQKFTTMLNFCHSELVSTLDDSLPENVEVLLMTSFTEYPTKINGYGFSGLEQCSYLLWEPSLLDQPPIKFYEIQNHNDFIAKSDNNSLLKVADTIERFLGVSGHVNRALRSILASRFNANFNEKHCYIEPLSLDGRQLKAKIVEFFQDRNNPQNQLRAKSILLTGDAGMGKTQFSLDLAGDLWQSYYQTGNFLPIYVDLKELCSLGFLSGQSKTFLESVIKILRRNIYFPSALTDLAILNYLRSNNLFYIIDGCDEIESSKLEFIFSSCFQDPGDSYGKIRQVIFTCREEALLGYSSEAVENCFSKIDSRTRAGVDYKHIRMELWGKAQIQHYLRSYVEKLETMGIASFSVKQYLDCFSVCCDQLPEFVELIRTPLLLRMIAPKLPEIVDKLTKATDTDDKKATAAKIYAYFFIEWIRREVVKLQESPKAQQLLLEFRSGQRLILYSAIYTINLAINLWKGSRVQRDSLSFNADLGEEKTLRQELLIPNLHASNILMQILDDASCFLEISEINVLKENFESLKKCHADDAVVPINLLKKIRSCSLLKVSSYLQSKFRFIHKSVNEYITGTAIFNKLMLLALEPADILRSLKNNDEDFFINIRPIRDQPNIINIIKQGYFKGSAKCDSLINKLWMLIDFSRQHVKLEIAASNALTLITAIDPFYFCNKDLSNTKIPYALISKSFFHNTNFNYADLSRAIFVDSDFFGATFVGAKLSVSMAEYQSINPGINRDFPALRVNNIRSLALKNSSDLLDLKHINDSWFAAHVDGNIYRLGDDLIQINNTWSMLDSDLLQGVDILDISFASNGCVFCITQGNGSISLLCREIPMKYSENKLVDRFCVGVPDIDDASWFGVDDTGRYILLKVKVASETMIYIYQVFSSGLSEPVCKLAYNLFVDFYPNKIKYAKFSPSSNQLSIINESSNLLLTIDYSVKDNVTVKIAEFFYVDSKLQTKLFSIEEWRQLFNLNVTMVNSIDDPSQWQNIQSDSIILCGNKFYVKQPLPNLIYQAIAGPVKAYHDLSSEDKRGLFTAWRNYILKSQSDKIVLHSITYANDDDNVYLSIQAPAENYAESELIFAKLNIVDEYLLPRAISAYPAGNSNKPYLHQRGSINLHYDHKSNNILIMHLGLLVNHMYLVDADLNIINNKYLHNAIDKVVFSNNSNDCNFELILIYQQQLVSCSVDMKTGEMQNYADSLQNAMVHVINENFYCVVKNHNHLTVTVLSASENDVFAEKSSWHYESDHDIVSVNVLSAAKLLVIDLLRNVVNNKSDYVAIPLEYITSKLRIVDDEDYWSYCDSTGFDAKDMFLIRKSHGLYSLRLMNPEKEIELEGLHDDFIRIISQCTSRDYCDDKKLLIHVLSIIAIPRGVSIIDTGAVSDITNKLCSIYDGGHSQLVQQSAPTQNTLAVNDILLLCPNIHGQSPLLSGRNYRVRDLLPAGLSEKVLQSERIICQSSILEFDRDFMPIVLVCYSSATFSLRLRSTPAIYYPGGELTLHKHEYLSVAMTSAFTPNAFEFTFSKIAANNTFYLALYKNTGASPIWCYKLSKTSNGLLKWRNEDYYLTNDSLGKIQFCLPSLQHNVVFHVSGAALFSSLLNVANSSRPHRLLHEMNVPIIDIQLIGPDEDKLLILNKYMVYLFSVRMINNHPQINLLWASGQYHQNYAFTRFASVHCESDNLLTRLNSLIVKKDSAVSCLPISSYRPCSSTLFKEGSPRLKDKPQLCSVLSNTEFGSDKALITVFCQDIAIIGRKYIPMEFTIEYLLNDRFFVMIYQFDKSKACVTCTDISTSYANHLKERRGWKLVPHELVKNCAKDGLTRALELENYIHGTIDCLIGNTDFESDWINFSLQRIALVFKDLEFVELHQPVIQNIYHYQ